MIQMIILLLLGKKKLRTCKYNIRFYINTCQQALLEQIL